MFKITPKRLFLSGLLINTTSRYTYPKLFAHKKQQNDVNNNKITTNFLFHFYVDLKVPIEIQITLMYDY